MSAVRFLCTKASLVLFHSERSRPTKTTYLSIYLSITRTHDDILDGLLLCVFVCLSVPMPPPHALSISHPEAFILYISYFILLSLSVLSREADRAAESGEKDCQL